MSENVGIHSIFSQKISLAIFAENMPYTPVECCSEATCQRHRIFAGKNFVGYLLDGQYDKCAEMLDTDPKLVDRMTWDSISWDGNWGMPLWRRVGYLMQEGKAPVDSREYQNIVIKITQLATKDSPSDYYTCLINYCLAAGASGKPTCWEMTLRDAIVHTAFEEKAKYGDRTLTGALKEIWDSWVEEKDETTCCVCMDAKPNASFSNCIHKEFCFACVRDLTECPLCRAKGYAKQQ